MSKINLEDYCDIREQKKTSNSKCIQAVRIKYLKKFTKIKYFSVQNDG